MNQPECTICQDAYDGSQHRPRALPCGHGFCTQCIEACIRNGDKSCPICRVGHGANSATDLPVSFLLEELLNKTVITPSAPYESDEEPEDESVDMCPKHKVDPLYFLCKSHSIKVCHSCTVIDHPAPSCELIPLDDIVNENKKSQIAVVQKQRFDIMSAEHDLKIFHQNIIDGLTKQRSRKIDLEKEVSLILTKIEEVDKEIFVMQESEDHIKGAIQSCQTKNEECEILENKLSAAKDYKTIKKELQTAAEEIIIFKSWEENLRMEHNLRRHKYAEVEKSGIIRSSKVIFDGGKTLIPCLSKEVIPPNSAVLIQEAELCLTSSTTTVFLDLSARGVIRGKEGGGLSLGRVEIKVLSDRPIGRQFVMLALGTEGSSYKGANFEWKYSNSFGLRQYVTEDNTKSEAALLVTIEKEYEENHLRGRLFTEGVNRTGFVIRTQDKYLFSCKSDYGYFGDVLTGMEVIDRAVSDKFAIKDIIISNCGIVMN